MPAKLVFKDRPVSVATHFGAFLMYSSAPLFSKMLRFLRYITASEIEGVPACSPNLAQRLVQISASRSLARNQWWIIPITWSARTSSDFQPRRLGAHCCSLGASLKRMPCPAPLQSSLTIMQVLLSKSCYFASFIFLSH